MNYEHIIWDWNGTLIDDTWLTVEIVNRILQEKGLPTLLHEEYRLLFDFPICLFNERVGLPSAGAPLQETSLRFISEYNQRRFECSLHRDTRRTLDSITRRGVEQSILSAYTQEDLSVSVEYYGLAHCFTELTGQLNSHGNSKIEAGLRIHAATNAPSPPCPPYRRYRTRFRSCSRHRGRLHPR